MRGFARGRKNGNKSLKRNWLIKGKITIRCVGIGLHEDCYVWRNDKSAKFGIGVVDPKAVGLVVVRNHINIVDSKGVLALIFNDRFNKS